MNAQIQLKEAAPTANLIIRGRVISTDLVEVEGRGDELTFRAPDVRKHIGELALLNPASLADLYQVPFDGILDYLEELGGRLRIHANGYLQEACEHSYRTAPTTKSVVDAAYEALPDQFNRASIREMADRLIGIPYLEGWVEEVQLSGMKIGVRCFGSRSLHIIAGNSPMVGALTIVRNAILRGDAIIKAPSNDPFTAIAIAKTMIDMAPDHPITRHLSVGYWRGGDEVVEQKLYQPHNIEKIVAWGGLASVKHVTRFIQPGLELISLDPKRSTSIIGPEAFESEEAMRNVAVRLAADIGALNQAACASSRVTYALSGSDDAGLEKLNRFGRHVYEAMMKLPASFSTKPKKYDHELKIHVNTLRLDDDWYKVIGGESDEGSIIVSQISEPVDFWAKLVDRTANLVPVDSLDQVVSAVDAYTQTVGVYPEELKLKLRDVLPLFGAQRLVSLGFAVQASLAAPQDAIEPLRRMGKWIVDETHTAEGGRMPWEQLGDTCDLSK